MMTLAFLTASMMSLHVSATLVLPAVAAAAAGALCTQHCVAGLASPTERLLRTALLHRHTTPCRCHSSGLRTLGVAL